MDYEARRCPALHKHYQVNAFFCENFTNLTLYRPRKVITYAHGRGLQMGDRLTIRRAVATDAKNEFVVRVVEIDEICDFVILEGDEDMYVSCPSFFLSQPGPCTQVCFGESGQQMSLHKVELQNFFGKGSVFWKGTSVANLTGVQRELDATGMVQSIFGAFVWTASL